MCWCRTPPLIVYQIWQLQQLPMTAHLHLQVDPSDCSQRTTQCNEILSQIDFTLQFTSRKESFGYIIFVVQQDCEKEEANTGCLD